MARPYLLREADHHHEGLGEIQNKIQNGEIGATTLDIVDHDVVIGTNGQKEIIIPIKEFNKEDCPFELFINSVNICKSSYDIIGDRIRLKEPKVFNVSDKVCIKEYQGNVLTPSVANRRPVEVKEIQGRTLVNLLGRTGNAIYQQTGVNVTDSKSTITYDKDNIVVTKTADGNIIYAIHNHKPHIKQNSYYIFISEVEVSKDYLSHLGLAGFGTGETYSILKTKGTTTYLGFMGNYADLSGAYHIDLICHQMKSGESMNLKNLRMYEISQTQYNQYKVLDMDLLIEKFPYVDDVKCVVNPYIENKENLLEDENHWSEAILHWNGGVDPNHNTGNLCNIGFKMKSKPNEVYNFTITDIDTTLYDLIIWNLRETNQQQTIISTSNSARMVCVNDGLIRVAVKRKDGQKTPEVMKQLQDHISNLKATLVKGDKPKTYEECHNSRIMFETPVYEGEKITRDSMGRYVKNSEWDNFNINGSDVLYVTKYTGGKGFKYVENKLPNMWYDPQNGGLAEPHIFMDYNGSYALHHHAFSANSGKFTVNYEPQYTGNWGTFSFQLPNILTGWGDNYTPTPEEIKAFFLGYKLSQKNTGGQPFNGTGEKEWHKLWCGIGNPFLYGGTTVCDNSRTETCPTTINDQGYTPYKLIYKKATPTQEIVKTHGTLNITKESTLIASSGLLLNKLAIPKIVKTQSFINADLAANPSTSLYLLKNKVGYRCEDILRIRNKTKVYSFIKNMGYEARYEITHGKRQAVINEVISDDMLIEVDYLIYKPDTVTSYSYDLEIKEDSSSVQDKLVEELSNTNLKLMEENQELKNRIEPLEKLCNPNLLINGDFQVWQRGETLEYTSGLAYYPDRWQINANYASSCTISKHPEGMKVYNKRENVTTAIHYKMEDADILKIKNKTVTLSFSINGEVRSYTVNNFNSTTNGVVYISAHGGTHEAFKVEPTLGIVFEFPRLATADSYYILNWVKLELGDKATPNIPRLYGEELALCQRYYEFGLTNTNVPITGFYNNLPTNYKVSKRTTPTLKIYGRPNKQEPEKIYIYGADNTSSGKAVAYNRIEYNNIAAFSLKTLALTGTFSNDSACSYEWTSDAEIY